MLDTDNERVRVRVWDRVRVRVWSFGRYRSRKGGGEFLIETVINKRRRDTTRQNKT